MRPWCVTSAPRRSSWSGTVDYHFTAEHRPTSLDELRRVVAGSRALRPVGTAHSFSDLPDGAEAVNLAALSEVEVAEDRSSVRVGAGLTHAGLAAALAPHGLALENLASLPHLNVVGAVATATHGSGRRTRNLATQVRALDLVTASGDLLSLRRGDPDFDGAVVGLGLLGVVHAVELDVVPAVDHRQLVLHDDDASSEDLPDHLDAILDLGRSVSVFTRWDDVPARVWVKWRDDEPRPDHRALGLRVADQPEHPIAGLDTVHCTLQGGVPGPWVERLPHFRPGYLPSVGDEVQSEYHLPREHGPAAARALAEVGHLLDTALLTSEVRTVAADTLWLSPQLDRDTCSFHFTWTSDTTLAAAAALVVEEALAPFSPRPHWGKHFAMDVRDAHPRLPDFLALRERLDPDRTFVGPWAERVLGV